MRLLAELSRALITASDSRAILSLVVDIAVTLFPARSCRFFLGEDSDDGLYLAAARGVQSDRIANLRPVDNPTDHPGLHQIALAPGDGIRALIEVDLLARPRPEEREILDILANLALAALQQIRLKDEHEQLLRESIMALAASIEARDPYTQGHSLRVAELAHWLGTALRLDDQQLEYLRIGAFLHDIGKIGIPEAVLLKDGRYVEEEFRVMQQHPVIGERILQHVTSLAPILPLVRSHHERLDGSGYPDGLTATDIPPLVRILSIADVFEALTSDRPYRPAMPLSTAINILDEGAGSQFDPDLVERFTALIRARADEGAFPIPVRRIAPDILGGEG